MQALECPQDRAAAGPVGGEVQGGASGVAGDLPGEVQGAVAQPLGFAGGVLAVEGQLLGPGEDVVSE